MRFICAEFTSNTNELYYKSAIDQTVISENGYLYYKSNKIDTKDGGVSYSYLNDITRKTLLSSWYYDGTARTIASFITNSGITGTDNTSYSNTFDWNVKSAMQIQSGYFYTILSESGLVFAKPQRISTSVQIGTFDILSEFINNETEFAFEGETATKYKLSDEKETVTPISIDSTMKTARMNKYKSLQNVITFQSGYDAKPLDYIFRNGKYYIVMSRTSIKQDLYMYTAVLEVASSYTFVGSTLIPSKPITSRYFALYRHTEAQNTNGGAVTNTTWTDKKLNTESFNTIPNCSLSTNQITLGIGTYRVTGWLEGYTGTNTIALMCRIWNVGTSSAIAYGIGAQSLANFTTVNTEFHDYVFTLPSTGGTISLQYYFNGGNFAQTYSGGVALNITGVSEVYAELAIEKTA